jgi:hypothetical protein
MGVFEMPTQPTRQWGGTPMTATGSETKGVMRGFHGGGCFARVMLGLTRVLKFWCRMVQLTGTLITAQDEVPSQLSPQKKWQTKSNDIMHADAAPIAAGIDGNLFFVCVLFIFHFRHGTNHPMSPK